MNPDAGLVLGEVRQFLDRRLIEVTEFRFQVPATLFLELLVCSS